MIFSVSYYVQILFFVGFGVTSSIIPRETAETSARIVNGYEVHIEEVPYQASLRRRVVNGWVHTCGAVIVNIRAILTAAHCADSYVLDPSSLIAVVGTNSRTSGGKTHEISQIFVHELYLPSTLANDIALLETAEDISFSSSVYPIKFASSDFIVPDGTEAVVSGFGTTSYEGYSSEILLAANVKIVNQDLCRRAYLRMAIITPEMICAGASNPARDACQGDSGGPMVVYNYLVGIVSWGEGCATDGYPGVYTRVSKYSTWIVSKIARYTINEDSI